jgi:predicted GNAT family N-acyltransferase
VEFRAAHTDEEICQVLELRALAYALAGKISSDASALDVRDKFDERAVLLAAWHHGRPVAALRLTTPTAGEQTDHEQYVDFPPGFPARDQIVEVTRVCTHPDYRGSDLLLGLLAHTALISAATARRYLLGSSTDALLPVYRRVGMVPTTVRFNPPSVGGREHRILLADARAVFGRKVNPIVWSEVFSDVSGEVALLSGTRLGVIDTVRYYLYRRLRPLCRSMVNRAGRKRAFQGRMR